MSANISPLYQHPTVREAAVIGVPDPYRGETVKAFVALKEGWGRTEPAEIVAFCNGFATVTHSGGNRDLLMVMFGHQTNTRPEDTAPGSASPESADES